MDLRQVEFPLYKLRSYLDIDNDLLGRVIVTTIKGEYILDDYSYNGTFEERRHKIAENEPDKLYKLKERVIYLRQLVKYKSGTTFIDFNGSLMKYAKSSKLYFIRSYKIMRKRDHGNWTIINVNKLEQPMLIGQVVLPTTTHASIMETKHGPFLYDLTSEYHEPYRRKI
jgi:hypothetical protein